MRRNHQRRKALVHWEVLDRSRFSGSDQPLAAAFSRGSSGLHHAAAQARIPQHGAHPPIDSPRRIPISTHESPEAALATHGGVGPVFRHDTNPTATSDRLRQLWQAGAHDITLTFSDDAPVPPPPGHSDR